MSSSFSRQLQRGSLGSLGKPVVSGANSEAPRSQAEEVIDRHYGSGSSSSASKKKRARAEGDDNRSGFNLSTRAPAFILGTILIVVGVIKLGGCALDNAIEALRMKKEQPHFDNPYFRQYR